MSFVRTNFVPGYGLTICLILFSELSDSGYDYSTGRYHISEDDRDLAQVRMFFATGRKNINRLKKKAREQTLGKRYRDPYEQSESQAPHHHRNDPRANPGFHPTRSMKRMVCLRLLQYSLGKEPC